MDDHKLFVGNMAARITQRDLWRFFSPYGLIDECAKFHESYAFVRFVHADDAQRARRETHGALLKGRKLKVEFAATVNKTNSSSWNQPSNHLFSNFSNRNFFFIIKNICMFNHFVEQLLICHRIVHNLSHHRKYPIIKSPIIEIFQWNRRIMKNFVHLIYFV
jgi:RNA recognition motif-containing protein